MLAFLGGNAIAPVYLAGPREEGRGPSKHGWRGQTLTGREPFVASLGGEGKGVSFPVEKEKRLDPVRGKEPARGFPFS